jgi:hypothetical protein
MGCVAAAWAHLAALGFALAADRKNPSQPRALIQQGRCDEGECNQFSISISNGERGMTVRFDSEAEFRNFLERGAAEKR